MSVKQAVSSDDGSRTDKKSPQRFWWEGLLVLLAIGLAARVVVALVSDNAHYPDEIFQLLEQAHRVVFGYGIVPWEFRYGTRSWIVPGFLACILSGCKALQLDYPNAYISIVKVCLCIISTSLILFNYVLARALSSEQAGRLAAFFTCFWYELIYFAHKPLTSILATYLFVGALACAADKSRSRPMLFGSMAALSMAVRIQLAPVVTVLALFVVFRWNKREILLAGMASSSVVILAGLVDYCTWGGMFISYYNNFLFNAAYKVSTLFGTRPFYWYLHALFASSMGLYLITIVWGLINPSKVWFPMACTAVILLLHSCFGHKEYRFDFTVVPLVLTMLAILVIETTIARVPVQWRKPFYLAIAICFIALSTGGLFRLFPHQEEVYRYAHPLSKNNSFAAYRLLSEKEDIVAIYDTSTHWASSGGYYYLHKDVPLYYRISRRRPLTLNTRRLHRYVSHVIKPVRTNSRSGFKEVVERIGDLEIVKQSEPRQRYLKNGSYSRDMYQDGVDNKYKPQANRRF